MYTIYLHILSSVSPPPVTSRLTVLTGDLTPPYKLYCIIIHHILCTVYTSTSDPGLMAGDQLTELHPICSGKKERVHLPVGDIYICIYLYIHLLQPNSSQLIAGMIHVYRLTLCAPSIRLYFHPPSPEIINNTLYHVFIHRERERYVSREQEREREREGGREGGGAYCSRQ